MALEAASGIILMAVTIISLIWANSPYAPLQARFVDHSLFYINEGLMTFFFMLVGIELKRGYLEGHLSRFSQVGLPLVAAIFGMVVPAIIYCIFNASSSHLLRGWAIPVATDIAFAMGVLSLFSKHVPFSLKLFLLSLAIFDDLGALLIIALFYSDHLSYIGLFQMIALIGLLWVLNLLKVSLLLPYFVIGAFLWLTALRTGIHPTIIGFFVAIMLPGGRAGKERLVQVENALHPWVAFLILPLFALANAGLSFEDISWQTIEASTLVLGIAAGLFVGKQLGVMMAVFLMVKLRLAKLPEKSTWLMVYGVAILCGIGFTMSLFLGTLSFQNNIVYIDEVRLGVIMGSVLSGLTAITVFILAFGKSKYHRSKVVE